MFALEPPNDYDPDNTPLWAAILLVILVLVIIL